MPLSIATVGGITIDNTINPTGLVGLGFPGGNGLYSAAGVRLWNRQSIAVGLAPTDFSQTWIAELDEQGVNSDGIFFRSNSKSDRKEWFIYAKDGSRTDSIFVSLKELEDVGFLLPVDGPTILQLEFRVLNNLIDELLKSKNNNLFGLSKKVFDYRREDFLQGIKRLDAVHIAPGKFEYQLNISNILKKNTGIISLDPGHYGKEINLDDLSILLKQIAIFLPSTREVNEILGPIDEHDAARLFADMGATIVVIKKGSGGSLLYNSLTQQFIQLPIFPTTIIDPTGCGDAFCGGFLSGYLETEDCYLAGLYGTIAASFAIEGFGYQALLHSDRSQAESRIAILRKNNS